MEKSKVTLMVIIVAYVVCSPVIEVKSDSLDHHYKAGDQIPLYANKVVPFNNPRHNSYQIRLRVPHFFFFHRIEEKKRTLGEELNGDRLVSAPYKLDFLVNKDSEVVCMKNMTKEDVVKFRDAVSKDYFFQMYYDDLSIWGFLGKVVTEEKLEKITYKYYIHPYSFVDITLVEDIDVEFTYTVKMHWFSSINSCVTVLLMTGFLATILVRVLRNDFVKYSHDEEKANEQEETGWKYIHGDVFRFPKYKSLLAASLGSGTQLFTLTVFIFLLGLVEVFYPYNRGALLTALVFIYALTSGIAGYTATSFYCQLEGSNWVRNLLLTGCLFFGPLLLTFCFLNTVAIAYHTTAAVPFRTIVLIVLISTFVTLSLLVLGGIAGKNSKAEFRAPCHSTKYPRVIPHLLWCRRSLPQMAIVGFLPFSEICIELHFIIGNVWGHRIYTTYSFLFVIFVILIIVTAFVTVGLTYFQLASEDHEWW
ncbi:hypothetical protein RND81_09G163900 [Saponaria officinalis]|uniref:Transmembrane 9 superfamily member n=1 Tax=Saponaria officinalis TaxID=3572 RepID=A0AAW1INE6_SAPOF